MTGVWVLAAAVVLFDVLVARQIVVEYRRYRYRRIMQRMTIELKEFARVLGDAFIPAIRKIATAFGEFATAVGEPYEERER